jgi:hypothetical protein
MTKYYHIHIGTKKIGKLINGKPLFLDISGGRYNAMWKQIAKNDEYDGYIEYSIDIPENLFTEELKPNTYKILRITKNNKKEYEKIIKKLKKDGLWSYLLSNNYIGLDTTDDLFHRTNKFKWIFSNELILYNFDKVSKLKIEEIVKF